VTSSPAAPEPTPRLYIASRSRHGARWRALRDNTCLPIVSTWIDEDEPGQTEDYGDLMRRCIEEASRATAFICYAEGDDIAGWKGVWFEMGAACAAGVPVFFVGTHDFPSALRHPNVTFCASLDDAVQQALSAVPRPASVRAASPAAPEPSGDAIEAAAKVRWVRSAEDHATTAWEEAPAFVRKGYLETALLQLRAAYAVDRPAAPQVTAGPWELMTNEIQGRLLYDGANELFLPCGHLTDDECVAVRDALNRVSAAPLPGLTVDTLREVRVLLIQHWSGQDPLPESARTTYTGRAVGIIDAALARLAGSPPKGTE